MRALALLMFLCATVPMAFVRPVIGLMLWIMFSYMNPHRISFGFATSFNWVMISAVVTMISTVLHSDQRQRLVMTPLIVLMTLFVAWTGISAFFGVETALARAEWVRFFKIVLMAYFTLVLVTDHDRVHWVLWTIVLSFGFWGFKGGLFTVLTGGGYNVMGPIKSFFRDTNGFALVMCMTLPLMRYLQLRERRRFFRLGLWALMGFTAVAIIGTYSRGGLLALGVTTLMLIYKSRRRASLVFVVPAIAVAIAAFMPQQWYERMNTINQYEQDKSAQGRIDSWIFATNVAISSPLIGGGMRVWASDSMWDTYGPTGAVHRAIHSIFFQVLGENGFIGLGLFIAMLGGTWLSLSRIRKEARAGPDTDWMADLASMMQVALVAYGAAGALLPMPYFDLVYQFIALTAVMHMLLARAKAGDRSAVRPQSMMAAIGFGPRGGPSAPAARRRRNTPRSSAQRNRRVV